MFKIPLARERIRTHVLNMFTSTSAPAMDEPVGAVLARRAGRIAFGLVLTGGMIVLAWWSLAGQAPPLVGTWRPHTGPPPAGEILEVIWLVAGTSYAIVRLGMRRAALAPRGDALLRASLVAPAVGLGLALPLSLHGLAFALPGAGLGPGFDTWADTSVRAVGLAHLVFAATFARRAAQLARSGAPTMSVGGIYLWAVLASAIPWGMFLLPEALTAVTGVFVLPVLFAFDRLAARERDALAQLPTARARRMP